MRLFIGLATALLLWSGVSDLLLDDAGYVPRNLIVTVALLLLARRVGMRADDLGASRRALPAGARWGVAAAAVVAAGLLIGAWAAPVVDPVRALLHDDRADLAPMSLAFATLVRIPVGTVLFEEIAFRGVLDAAGTRVWSRGWAVAASAAVFGAYHVPPTIMALQINEVPPTSPAGLGVLAGAVAISAFAGAAFSWLRIRSGSLLAPALAHLATNVGGLLTAAAVQD